MIYRLAAGAAVFVLLCSSVVMAQKPRGSQNRNQPRGSQNRIQPNQPRPSVRWQGQGSLAGVRGNLLYVVADDGSKWIALAPENDQNVSLTGSADPRFLKRGMFVRFTGEFNARGVPQGAIDEITIFTPREGNQFGVFPAGGPDGPALFGEKPKQQKKTAAFRVAGRVAGVTSTTLTVNAGGTNLRIPLTKTTSLRVDLADYTLGQPGDSVRLEGMHYPGKEGQLYASRVQITPKNPLGAPAAKQPSPKVEEN